MRTVATKVDNELAERFSKHCEAKGCTHSEELRSLMKAALCESQEGTAPAAKKTQPAYRPVKVVLRV